MLTSLRPLYKVTCCQETVTMQMSRNTFLLHRAMKKTSNAFIAFWKSQATLQNHLSASSRWLKAFHMKISIFKFLEQNGCEIIGYKSVFKSSAKEKNRCWLYYNINPLNALLQVVMYGHRIPFNAHIKDSAIACANQPLSVLFPMMTPEDALGCKDLLEYRQRPSYPHPSYLFHVSHLCSICFLGLPNVVYPHIVHGREWYSLTTKSWESGPPATA